MTARYDQMGAVMAPATGSVSTGGSLVTLCDPVIGGLLAAFKSTLNTKLAAVWASANASYHAYGTNPVNGTYDYEPIPELAKRGWQWPALFMWREQERLFERTQVHDAAEVRGRLVYVLPPMPYEHATRLGPIRVAARVVLVGFVENHGDPEYSSGADILTTYSLDSLTLTQARYGYLEGAQRMQLHPTVDFTFSMVERSVFVAANYSTLSRIDSTYEVKDEDDGSGGTDLIESQYDPTS